MATVLVREPDEFAAGDTLQFTRSLSDYPASSGWSLIYELRGQSQSIEFTSTADGDAHAISVDATTTATWLPGDYVLAGYAVNGGERHQVYEGSFEVTPNLPQSAGNEDQRTFSQKMIAQIETVMLAKAGDDLAASQVGDNRFQYLTPEQLRTEHAYWLQVRKTEVQKLNAKNGKSTGTKIHPRFNIKQSGPIVGQQWPSGYTGW